MNTTISQSSSQQAERITEESTLKINNIELKNYLKQLSQSDDDKTIDKVISLYKNTIVKLEQEIWQNEPTGDDIQQYQNEFKTLEKLYRLKRNDDRYNFKIVIPVADRPQHLKQCLSSLLTLCQSYEYGGFKNDQYTKISVLIADDSKHQHNINLHKSYCTDFSNKGISTEYFGLEEQLALINDVTAGSERLRHIIPSTANINNPGEFSHKGASIMRNISYLKLNKNISALTPTGNTLIYFIDSDQEFCINSTVADNNTFAINYFHYLNDIFKSQDISILTGKVVGDPPVSPSVMAGNFQQDIKSFLNLLAETDPQHTCQFHQHQKTSKDDAAYHDMANLFGFSSQHKVFQYHCTLQEKHNNADCFSDFSNKLKRFFYGEHPTRKTHFNYEHGFAKTSPARTVYTGNYVIKPESLKYFIPFATLKLRMAGPVLGRILKTDLHHGFVSANLPMLHNRTVESSGTSEFRAGVKSNKKHIDLGNEFIRQFFGDVLLFSMEEITAAGFPGTAVNRDAIETILKQTYKNIRSSYIEKHNTILQLKTDINEQLNEQSNWWNKSTNETHKLATSRVNDFLQNIQLNFDENTYVYQQITSSIHAQTHLDRMLHAILHYQDDIISWEETLISR